MQWFVHRKLCPVAIGIYYFNTEKSRVEPGRMPKVSGRQNIFAYGMPVPQDIKADTMTIAQIKAAGPALYNKLVCIKMHSLPDGVPTVDDLHRLLMPK